MSNERLFDDAAISDWEMTVEAHLDVVEMCKEAEADALAQSRREDLEAWERLTDECCF